MPGSMPRACQSGRFDPIQGQAAQQQHILQKQLHTVLQLWLLPSNSSCCMNRKPVKVSLCHSRSTSSKTKEHIWAVSNVPLLPSRRWLGQDLVWGPWPILAVSYQDLYLDLLRIARLYTVSREKSCNGSASCAAFACGMHNLQC